MTITVPARYMVPIAMLMKVGGLRPVGGWVLGLVWACLVTDNHGQGEMAESTDCKCGGTCTCLGRCMPLHSRMSRFAGL